MISIETRRAYSDVEETSEDLVTVRKQQLATALLRMSEHTEKKQWTEAINLLTQVLKSIDENNFDQEKSVNTLLEITQAYIKSHQFEKAEESISQVYSRINNIASRYCSVPVDILRERVCYCEGLLAKELGDYRRAAELLTTCLEMNSIYDPVIRCSALKQLRLIFETRGLDCWEVDQHIEDYEAVNKDIVFLMDYSESMMYQNRIQKALSNIINVFDKFVEKDDRVAFILFNKECHIAFNLTAKGQNTAFLRQHILKWNKPSGQTAFYDAVSTALNEFSAYKDDCPYECDLLVINEEEEESMNRVPKRAKWILALTDGEDTCSSISYRKLKAKLE